MPQTEKKIIQETPVPQDWFQAFFEANGYLPQNDLAITVALGQKILSEKADLGSKDYWQQCLNSSLSAQQIQELGQGMTKMHRGHKIPHAVAGSEKKSEAPVKLSRLKEVWTMSLNYTLQCILDFCKLSTRERKALAEKEAASRKTDAPWAADAIYNVSSVWAEPLANFFADPSNKERIQSLKLMLYIAEQALLLPEQKVRAHAYKKLLSEKTELQHKILSLEEQGQGEEARMCREKQREVIKEGTKYYDAIRQTVSDALKAAGLSKAQIATINIDV